MVGDSAAFPPDRRCCYGLPVRALFIAALSGVLYFVGFVGFGVWPLVFLFQAVLLLAIEGRTPRQAFGLGALSGFVAMCGGYYWVVHLLQAFAGLSLPLAVLGYVLLNIYQGLLWGFVAWLVARARRDLDIHPGWALPVAVIGVTWMYPLLFPSFVSASFFELPWLTQIADLGGAYLVDGLVALVNGGIYAVLSWKRFPPGRRALRLPPAAAASLVATLVYGGVRVAQVDASMASAPTLDVALVQANLGARDKTAQRQEFLLRHQRMSRAAIAQHPQLDLVVWPESAFNYALRRNRRSVARDITVGVTRPVLSGAITVGKAPDGTRQVFNSAVLTSSTGEVRGIFDKVRLLHFGETIPLVDTIPQLKKWFPRSGTFDRGTSFQPFVLDDGTKLLPMICYEDLIPSFVHRMWSEGGPPHALVNVTNDSWYGDTHEPLIHLALATLRSIETRRALIRSTNTGISAIVDPAGRITARTGQWTQETLVAAVPLVEDGSSPLYMWVGDWPCWLAVLTIAAGAFLARRRRSRG